MKKSPRIVFFILFALIIFIVFTAFFGIENYFGDTRIVYFKGIDDIVWGSDISNSANAIIGAKKGEKITETDLNLAGGIISNRLNALGFTAEDVAVNLKGKKIVISFKLDPEKNLYNMEDVIDQITSNGVVEVRKGSDADGELLFGNEGIASAQLSETESGTGQVNLSLNEISTETYKTATEELAKSNGTVSIWIDGKKAVEQKIDSAVSGGTLTLTDASTVDGLSDRLAVSITNKISSGSIAEKFRLDSYDISTSLDTGKVKNAAIISLLIVLAIAALYLIVVNKLPGLIGAIALVGVFASTFGMITGYLGVFNGITLTFPGIIAMAIVVVFGASCSKTLFDNISNHVGQGKNVDTAIEAGSKDAIKMSIVRLVPIVLVSAAIMIINGLNYNNSVFTMGYVLLLGSVLSIVFSHYGLKAMLKSLSNFSAFDSPSLYGGKE